MPGQRDQACEVMAFAGDPQALDPEWLTLSSTSKPDKNAITGNGHHGGASSLVSPWKRQPGRSN